MTVDFAFIDSGTGGIPYMNYLRSQCPHAACLYLADTAHFPYGTKTAAQIIECAQQTAEMLISVYSPRAVVIACNTMSVTALSALRERFAGTPFIGTVPAIKQAAAVTHNRVIGLLATERTIADPYTDTLIKQFAGDCTVLKRADAALIDFIEHRYFYAGRQERMEAVQPAVRFFAEGCADTIILGCTHFIHAAHEIQEAAGSAVQVIDSRAGVVRQALKISGGIPQPAQTTAHAAPPVFCISSHADAQTERYYRRLCTLFGLTWGGSIQRHVVQIR